MTTAKAKMISPKTDSDWTIHSLNIQGTFFERWCQETIREQPEWKLISTNYPVEFPKHNGPFSGEQSTLDIYAQLQKKTILLTLLIECKKNNPGFIDWVFFPHQIYLRKHNHFSGLMIANSHPENPEVNWKSSTMIGPMISLKWIPTSDAWETRGNYQQYKRNDKTKTSNNAIYNAAHQVALATRSIFGEEVNNNKILSARNVGISAPYDNQIFIPVIVTTAKLFTCSFSPKDVNQKTGEIPIAKVNLQEQPYVLYEYPIPANLHLPPLDMVEALKTGNKDFGTRMDILVVNSSRFVEFLLKLEKGNA